jgi:hypothetical protein
MHVAVTASCTHLAFLTVCGALQERGEKGHGWFMATLEGVAVAYLAVRMCSFAGRIQAQAALAVYNLLYQSIGVYTAWPTSTRTNSPGEATLQELIIYRRTWSYFAGFYQVLRLVVAANQLKLVFPDHEGTLAACVEQGTLPPVFDARGRRTEFAEEVRGKALHIVQTFSCPSLNTACTTRDVYAVLLQQETLGRSTCFCIVPKAFA